MRVSPGLRAVERLLPGAEAGVPLRCCCGTPELAALCPVPGRVPFGCGPAPCFHSLKEMMGMRRCVIIASESAGVVAKSRDKRKCSAWH